MPSFYNEIDPYAAAWLRNLIKAGHIPDGEVSTQSIVDLRPADLSGFDQCHFFAGIGGWSQALRLAGWAPDRPVWTGSCPCQPFSVAGKGAGIDDARHLWPHFHRLIAACRPPVVMGEQVAGKAGYGWFDGVRADLEGTGYAGRAVDIPALAVNAPHIRQRLYWVALDMANAQNNGQGRRSHSDAGRSEDERRRDDDLRRQHLGSCSSVRDVANAQSVGREERERQDGQQDAGSGSQGRVDAAGTDESHMADAQQHGHGCEASPAHHDRQEGDGPADQHGGRGGSSVCSHMADAHQGGRGRRPCDGDGERNGQAGGWVEDHGLFAGSGEDRLDVADAAATGLQGSCNAGERAAGMGSQQSPGNSGHWDDHIWLTGSDGKARRARANIPLLAHGLSDNVGRMCPEGYAQAVEEVDKYAQKTGQSRSEAMSAVRQIISQEPETFWPVGECAGVSSQEILFPFLRELSSACDAGRGIGPSEEIQKGEMRGLRDQEQATRSSYRREPVEQRPGEHSDPMRELSWVLAQHARALWEAYWRSNATAYPLLSHGEKNRVGRLRAYGNAIVPPLAAEVVKALMETLDV